MPRRIRVTHIPTRHLHGNTWACACGEPLVFALSADRSGIINPHGARSAAAGEAPTCRRGAAAPSSDRRGVILKQFMARTEHARPCHGGCHNGWNFRRDVDGNILDEPTPCGVC